jgi:hypothetical protein
VSGTVTFHQPSHAGEYLQLSRPLIIPFQGHRYCQRRPVADRFKATDPLWSGFEHGLSVPLPHVELAGVDPYRVVHDAVEDGVAAETAVPFLGGQLGRECLWSNKRVQRHHQI